MTENRIVGDGNAVATESSNLSQSTSVVKGASSQEKGDLAALLRAARTVGLSDEEMEELRTAVDEDAQEGDQEQPGTRVKLFLAKTMLGAGGKVGIAAAGGTLANIIRSYYGL